jgi:hypothetical protein
MVAQVLSGGKASFSSSAAFFFFSGAGAWIQGLHFQPLHQLYFCAGFFQDRVSWNYLPALASNHDPPDLCLLSSQYYRRDPLRCFKNLWEERNLVILLQ